MTLTSSTASPDDIHRSFRVLKERIRRRWPFEYITVREHTDSGLAHLHIVYRGVEGYDRARIIAPFAGMGGALKQMVGAPIVLEGDISKLHALSEWGLAAMEMWRGMRIYNTDLTT